MPEESILFTPTISERDLDREVDQVNDQLADAATDIPVSMDGEFDGLQPPGGGIGGADDGGLGPGGAAGAAGLASRLPKPVSGVLSSAAVPIAIAGGVGTAMLTAMQGASARLQTSQSLLGVMVDNFFRAPGDILDKHVVRPLVNQGLGVSTEFSDAVRDLQEQADGDILPRNLGDFETRVGLAIDTLETLPGPIGRVAGIMEDVANSWNGWPNVGELWPGWPNIGELWPGWPDIGTPPLPDWSDLSPGVPDWTSLAPPLPDWSDLNPFSGSDGNDDPTTDQPQEPTDTPSGAPGTPGGGANEPIDQPTIGVGGDISPINLNGGGRVTRTGVARVHRGELVTDEQRLVSELADAIAVREGGGTDTAALEAKLDEVNRNLRRLASAMDVTLEVGKEQIGRAASEGRREGLVDTDPTV